MSAPCIRKLASAVRENIAIETEWSYRYKVSIALPPILR